jgi:hypothetical protein
VNELFHWNFGDISPAKATVTAFTRQVVNADDEKQGASQELHLPATWAQSLFRSGIFEKVYSVYDVLLEHGRAHSTVVISECLANIGLLLISAAAINGPFFSDAAEKLQAGNSLVSMLLPRLTRCLESISSVLSQPGNASSSAVDIMTLELQQFSVHVVQLVDNFGLSSLCKMPSFRPLLLLAAQDVVLHAQILHSVSALYVHKNSGVKDLLQIGEGSDLLAGWCGESLRQLLTAFAAIANDPVLVSPSTGQASEEQATRKLVLTEMRDLTASMFTSLFDALSNVVVCSVLCSGAEEEDEDEVIEVLDSAKLNDLVSSCCFIGRLNAVPSLSHIRDKLDAANVHRTSQQPQQQCVYLESVRISMLFVSHFCVENFASSTGEATYETSGSSESPTIPALIVDTALTDPMTAESMAQCLCHVFASFCQTLQSQYSLLQPATRTDTLLSPLIVQMSLDFVAEYIVRYASPDSSSYGKNSVSICSHLRRMHG